MMNTICPFSHSVHCDNIYSKPTCHKVFIPLRKWFVRCLDKPTHPEGCFASEPANCGGGKQLEPLSLQFKIFWMLVFCCLQISLFSSGFQLRRPGPDTIKLPGTREEIVHTKIHPVFKSVLRSEEFSFLFEFSTKSGWHIYGKEETIGHPTTIKLLTTGFEILETDFSPSVKNETRVGDEKMINYYLPEPAWGFMKIKAKKEMVFPPSMEIEFEIKYQPCTNTTCQSVETLKKTQTIHFGTHEKSELPKEALLTLKTFQKEEKTRDKNQDNNIDKNLQKGWFYALLMAFLWGIAASLTPCVYPMIPITVSLFSSENSSRSKKFINAMIYVLGIALVYAILGLVAAKTGKDLGSWLAMPAVVIPIALIMLILALSMFGLFEMDLPSSLKGKLSSIEGQNPLALFLMGGAMGFVASPCVGPFAAAIILWLIKNPQSPFFGFLLMASFGLGLGILFLIIALFSSKILPKSGMWMIRVKAGMGYLLIGMAYYFLKIFLDEPWVSLGWALWFFIAGSLGGAFCTLSWESSYLHRLTKSFAILLIIISLITAIQPFWAQFPNVQTSVSINKNNDNVIFTHQKALESAKSAKKPLFLYFGAKYCIPCKKIKGVVLKDERVKKELERFIQGILDCTDSESENAMAKTRIYQSAAMPFFAFYDSKGNYRKELSVEGALDQETLLNILKKID